jgi:hypothetical protein
MRADIVADGRFADCELTDRADIASSGPGSFSGPFVDILQALAVLAAFIAAFAAISAVLLRRRDVV